MILGGPGLLESSCKVRRSGNLCIWFSTYPSSGCSLTELNAIRWRQFGSRATAASLRKQPCIRQLCSSHEPARFSQDRIKSCMGCIATPATKLTCKRCKLQNRPFLSCSCKHCRMLFSCVTLCVDAKIHRSTGMSMDTGCTF